MRTTATTAYRGPEVSNASATSLFLLVELARASTDFVAALLYSKAAPPLGKLPLHNLMQYVEANRSGKHKFW
jgi:hypothetical protein